MAKVVPEQAEGQLQALLRRYRFVGKVYIAGNGEIHVRLSRSVESLTASKEKLDAFEEELDLLLGKINAAGSTERTEIARTLGQSDFAEMMRRRRDGSRT